MKKSLTAALIAAFVVTTAGTAMASSFPEFKFDGDLRTHYRWETQTGKEDTKGGKVWFRLNAKSEIFDNVELYTRLTTQKLTGDFIGADFVQVNPSFLGASAKVTSTQSIVIV